MISHSAAIVQQIKEIVKVAKADPAANHLPDLMLYMQEEFGEIAQCVSTDLGLKYKNITEPTHVECIDLIIGTFAVFFQSGGKIEDIASLIDKKLGKWKKRLEKHIDNKKNRPCKHCGIIPWDHDSGCPENPEVTGHEPCVD